MQRKKNEKLIIIYPLIAWFQEAIMSPVIPQICYYTNIYKNPDELCSLAIFVFGLGSLIISNTIQQINSITIQRCSIISYISILIIALSIYLNNWVLFVIARLIQGINLVIPSIIETRLIKNKSTRDMKELDTYNIYCEAISGILIIFLSTSLAPKHIITYLLICTIIANLINQLIVTAISKDITTFNSYKEVEKNTDRLSYFPLVLLMLSYDIVRVISSDLIPVVMSKSNPVSAYLVYPSIAIGYILNSFIEKKSISKISYIISPFLLVINYIFIYLGIKNSLSLYILILSFIIRGFIESLCYEQIIEDTVKIRKLKEIEVIKLIITINAISYIVASNFVYNTEIAILAHLIYFLLQVVNKTKKWI